jgi:hypothetical protein
MHVWRFTEPSTSANSANTGSRESREPRSPIEDHRVMSRFREIAYLDLPAMSSLLAEGEPPVDALDPQEWLGVAFQITAHVLAADADAEPRDWAVRCRAIEHAAHAVHATGLEDDAAHLTRRLNASGAMLARTQPRGDVELLDPEAMLDRLFRSLPMTADEARGRAAHWRDLPLPQVLELRKVKNLLTPGLAIARLAPVPRFEGDVDTWGAVRPLLP